MMTSARAPDCICATSWLLEPTLTRSRPPPSYAALSVSTTSVSDDAAKTVMPPPSADLPAGAHAAVETARNTAAHAARVPRTRRTKRIHRA